jgi:hypothetical protein
MKLRKFFSSYHELGDFASHCEKYNESTLLVTLEESGIACFDPSSLLKNGLLKKKASLVSGKESGIKRYLGVKKIKGFRTTEGKMCRSEQ